MLGDVAMALENVYVGVISMVLGFLVDLFRSE